MSDIPPFEAARQLQVAVERLVREATGYVNRLSRGDDLSFGHEERVNAAAMQLGLPRPFDRREGAGPNARSIYVGYNDSVAQEAGGFRIVDHLGVPVPLSSEDRARIISVLRNLASEAQSRAADLKGAGSIDAPYARVSQPTPTPSARAAPRKSTKNEANIKAREFLKMKPGATARELADGIGCSLGLISRLPAWQAVQEQRANGREPKPPRTVNLSSKLQRIAGAVDESLEKLLREQESDHEPSPLDDDPPDRNEGSPRKAKIYRRR